MARTKKQKAAPLRHPAIAEIKRIGPIFPEPDSERGLGQTRREARGGKDTKPPYRNAPSRRRRSAEAITARCLSCRWSTSGRTWRPTKRRLAEHVGKKHPKLAAAS